MSNQTYYKQDTNNPQRNRVCTNVLLYQQIRALRENEHKFEHLIISVFCCPALRVEMSIYNNDYYNIMYHVCMYYKTLYDN